MNKLIMIIQNSLRSLFDGQLTCLRQAGI